MCVSTSKKIVTRWIERAMHRVNEKHNKEKVACEKQGKINEEKALNMVNFRISHR